MLAPLAHNALDTLLHARQASGWGGLFHGVHVALVTDLRDPDNQGRVKVKLPWLPDSGGAACELWARLATMMGGNNRGSWFIPDVDDEVLVAFAQAARDVLRDTDLVARWGGEEFLIVLPDTHEASKARQALERLQSRLRTTLVSETVPTLRISFSAGYALWRAPEGVDVLLQRADRALYAAKHAGRDRCVQAD